MNCPVKNLQENLECLKMTARLTVNASRPARPAPAPQPHCAGCIFRIVAVCAWTSARTNFHFRSLHSVRTTSGCSFQVVRNPDLISSFEFLKIWLQFAEELIIRVESLKMFEVLEKPLNTYIYIIIYIHIRLMYY